MEPKMQVSITSYATGLTQYVTNGKGILSVHSTVNIEFQRDIYDDLTTWTIQQAKDFLDGSEVIHHMVLDENHRALSEVGEAPEWSQF